MGVDGDYYGIAFGRGQFVAVGGNARGRYDHSSAIATSPDGVQWTARVPAGYGFLYGITMGEDLFVAVGGYYIFGSHHQTVQVSSDGIHWSNRSADNYGIPLLRAIAFARETYVAVGALGTALVSADGLHWESRYPNERPDLRAVTSGNGVAVAAGYLNSHSGSLYGHTSILRSTDGLRWTPGESEFEVPLSGVTFGSGRFIAVGATWYNDPYYGVVLSSDDGRDWCESLRVEGWSPRGVSWGNGLFVAIGNRAAAFTSPDGVRWSSQQLPGTAGLEAIAFQNSRFVAISFENSILSSADGTNWTIGPFLTDGQLTSVAGGNGLFVIVAGDQTLTSSNALDWTVNDLPDLRWLEGLGFAGHQFFARDGFRFYTSVDGINWIPEQMYVSGSWSSPAALTAFTEHQHTTIGVGTYGIIVQSDPVTDTPPSVVMTSAEPAVWVGGSASFIAVAGGTPPLEYQWFKNGQAIPDATSLVLTLEPVCLLDAAEYAITVSNPVGTVTAQPVSLMVTPVPIGPVILSLARDTLSELTVTAPPGSRCRIESTGDLEPPGIWTLRKAFTARRSVFTWLDGDSVGAPQRFYRVALDR